MLAREFDLSVIDSFHFSDFKFERFELLFRHCTTHAPTIRNLFGSSRNFCLCGIKVFSDTVNGCLVAGTAQDNDSTGVAQDDFLVAGTAQDNDSTGAAQDGVVKICDF